MLKILQRIITLVGLPTLIQITIFALKYLAERTENEYDDKIIKEIEKFVEYLEENL